MRSVGLQVDALAITHTGVVVMCGCHGDVVADAADAVTEDMPRNHADSQTVGNAETFLRSTFTRGSINFRLHIGGRN